MGGTKAFLTAGLGFTLLTSTAIQAMGVPPPGDMALAVAQATEVPLGDEALVAAVTSTNPPAADYQVWREDELFVPLSPSGQLQSTSYEYDAVTKTLAQLTGADCQPQPTSDDNRAVGMQIGAAAGRVTSPLSDQVVIAYPTAASTLKVEFADACDKATGEARPSTTLDLVLGHVTGLPYFFDIATGDLDRSDPETGFYRDEVVVAYAADSPSPNPFNLVIAVLDYTTTPVTVRQQSIPAAVPRTIVSTSYDIAAIPLAVTTGDFDGATENGKEIAVAYLSTATTIEVAVYRYTTAKSLDLVSNVTSRVDEPSSDWDARNWIGSLDAVAGDFNGDGWDELSVAASVREKEDRILDRYRVSVNIKTFQRDHAALDIFALKMASGKIVYADEGEFGARVQLASGLFKYDPLTGYDINRRQIALATNGSSGAVGLKTFVYDTALAPTEAGYQRIPPTGDPSERLKFWMAAGAFKGLQSSVAAADVVWSLAFTTWDKNGLVLYLFDPDAATGKLGTQVFTKTLSTTAYPTAYKYSSVVPIVAYDYGKPPAVGELPQVMRGDAQFLGPPTHFLLEEVLQTKAVIQEPPKHAYWDKQLQRVETVSYYDTTYAQLVSTDKKTFNTRHKSTSDFSLGADASTSTKVEASLPIPLFTASASAQFKASFGYDFKSHEEEYNSSSNSLSSGAILTTSHDDAIAFTGQTLHVWRYPVYGMTLGHLPDGTAINGYMDIVLPDKTPLEQYAAGKGAEWYQPVHENGNILSYPVSAGSTTVDPRDMGTFRIPCPSVEDSTCVEDSDGALWKEVSGKPLGDFTGTISGVSADQWVTMSSETGAGQEHQYTHSLSESLDLTTTAKVSIPGVSVSEENHIGFQSGQSWGEVTTQETTAEVTEGVKIVTGSGTTTQEYAYHGDLYVTTDGTWKLAFATKPPALESQAGHYFWYSHYSTPDPALNLPTRFKEHWTPCASGTCLTGWDPNPEPTRNLLRGFFVRSSSPDPVSGAYPLLGRSPRVGESVRLEARVYNYSLVAPVSNLVVRFEAMPLRLNPDTMYPEEDPGAVPQVIGEATLAKLDPRGMQVATIDWDTTGFGPVPDDDPNTVDPSTRDWHIRVVLDPNNAITNETYESEELDPTNWPGQNNEGWYPVTVAAPFTAAPPGVAREVKLEKNAMGAIARNGKLQTHTVRADIGQPLQIRVLAGTNLTGSDLRRVQLFDGDPNAGGVLIGDRQVSVGDPTGKAVWFEWTPTVLGQHRLYATLLPISTDDSGNTVDDLRVVVTKVPPGQQKQAGGRG